MDEVRTLILVGGVLGLLAAATGIGQFLKRQAELGLNPAVVRIFNSRLRAWWLMCTVLAAAFLLGSWSRIATVVLFGMVSFWALREFITLTPTRLGDHRALFWVFFFFTPLQYVLVGMERYALYSILLPVYAFLFIPARVAVAGDYKRFLERTAKIQSGLIICVYCLSYAPAMLSLDSAAPRASEARESGTATAASTVAEPAAAASDAADSPAARRIDRGQNARLLFFFVLIVQLNDVLQYAWGKLLGQHVIAPHISPNRTWEGFLLGAASATLVGTTLCWATPFEPWVAGGLSLVTAVMGFAGGLTMSAIKRDRGVRDYGTLVVGHGGVLDRIDSICFAAPVFYHLTQFYLQ